MSFYSPQYVYTIVRPSTLESLTPIIRLHDLTTVAVLYTVYGGCNRKGGTGRAIVLKARQAGTATNTSATYGAQDHVLLVTSVGITTILVVLIRTIYVYMLLILENRKMV